MDKELQKILKTNETGKRYADKLVKVYLTSGEEKWLLIHVEVQGYREADLAERIYTYNYRIFDRYRKEVISAVILTDPDPGYRPDRYVRSRWGFTHTMAFPLVKLIDYRKRRDELKANANPFALVVERFYAILTVLRGEEAMRKAMINAGYGRCFGSSTGRCSCRRNWSGGWKRNCRR